MYKKPLEEYDFVAFDIETTGRKPEKGGRIIQIAAVPFRVNVGCDENVFNCLINPMTSIPFMGATSVHGITNDMVRDKPTIKEVLPRFYKFIESKTLIAHNANYDLSYINYEAKQLDLPVINQMVIDTLTISKNLFPFEGRHGLISLSRLLDVNADLVSKHHDAVHDAEIVANIFIKLLNILKREKVTTLADLLIKIK